MKILKKYKNKIISLLISTIILSMFYCAIIYSGQWQLSPLGMMMYMGDNGKFAQDEWRWIDSDGDSIAECYRFNAAGFLIASAYAPDGKYINNKGQWEEDGIVQQIYYNNFKPLPTNKKYQNPFQTVQKPTSSEIKLINATGKDLEKLAKEKQNKKTKGKKQYSAPIIATVSYTDGIIYTKINKKVRPEVDKINGTIITAYTGKDGVTSSTYSTPTYLLGADMSKKVSASKNLTKNIESTKVYGGQIWEDCMCLAGDDAYLKCTLDGNNYMRVEVAHQTHGVSTSETLCYLELYIDGEFIDSYDSFVDGEPLVIEQWFDDGEKNFELKWIVESGSKGRKLYLRNGRLRKFKYND